jgi:hypothetical protein
LDADISAFFDHVDWERLLSKLDSLFPDEPLIVLLRRWITADVVYQGRHIRRSQGLPLGISVSPLLANLYLDDFDSELGMQGFRLVRYADDFVVLAKDADSARRALEASSSVLAHLSLELNMDKTRIVSLSDGFSYLGYLFCRSLVIDESLSAHEDHAKHLDPIVKSTWISHLQPDQLRAITPAGRLLAPARAVSPAEPSRGRSPSPNSRRSEPVDYSALARTDPGAAASLSDAPSTPVTDENGPPQERWGLYIVGRETGVSIHYGSLSILALDGVLQGQELNDPDTAPAALLSVVCLVLAVWLTGGVIQRHGTTLSISVGY